MTFIDINGKKTTQSELEESLNRDNIYYTEENSKVADYLKDIKLPFISKRIYSNRYENVKQVKDYIDTKLNTILNGEYISKHLPTVLDSTPIINKHIENNSRILIVVDYDVDGVTSGAIAYKMFVKLFEYTNIEMVVNKRANGNGINTTLTKDICDIHTDRKFDLMITADHGSSDRVNITIIKEKLGVDIIVTDHHLYKDDLYPNNVEAFVNPQQNNHLGEDNIFKSITGATVIYFTLLHVYFKHENKKSTYKTEYIYYLLNYVGMTVISDCMDLKSFINRKIITKMLHTLNNRKPQMDMFWKYVKNKIYDMGMINESTIGYNVTPMLNSPGRIADARLSYELLISEDEFMTNELYEDVSDVNDKRKLLKSKTSASKDIVKYTDGVVLVALINNSEGIQGIIANDYLYNDKYRVVVCFTKKRQGDGYIYAGSGRSLGSEFPFKEVVDNVKLNSDTVIEHGGHNSAVGLKIKPDLKKFYDSLVKESHKFKLVKEDKQYIDDYIYSFKKILVNLQHISDISPFGIGFDKPLFCSDFIIGSFRVIEKSNYYLIMSVTLPHNGSGIINVFYTIKESEYKEFEYKLRHSKQVRMVYNLDVNVFNNNMKIQINPTYIKFLDKE